MQDVYSIREKQHEYYIHNGIMYFNRTLIANRILAMESDELPKTPFWDRFETTCSRHLSYSYTWSIKSCTPTLVKINKTPNHKMEGIWHMSDGYWHPIHKQYQDKMEKLTLITDEYPIPQSYDHRWPGQIKYMKALLIIENSHLTHIDKMHEYVASYFGDVYFNSKTYWYNLTGEYAYSWPEHYLLHDIYLKNVKPSKEHYDLIIKLAENLMCDILWKKSDRYIDIYQLPIDLYFLKYVCDDKLIRNGQIYLNELQIRRKIEQLPDEEENKLIWSQMHMPFKCNNDTPQMYETKVEGHWNTYYKPLAQHDRWPGQIKYMKALNMLEKMHIKDIKNNDHIVKSQFEDLYLQSKEYTLISDIKYSWSSNLLLYYVYMHNVQPSKEHYYLVLNTYKGIFEIYNDKYKVEE